jgi:branched-chain amino acid transport system substrate-binding protein
MTRRALAMLVSLAMVIAACAQAPAATGPAGTTSTGGSAPPSTAAAGTLKVGFVGVQSGEFAEFGKFTLQGSQLAVEDWNEKGGVNGRQVELLVEDDRFDPNQALIVIQKLLDQNVEGFIGPGASSTIIPGSLMLEGAKMVNIHAGSNPIITDRGLQYTFRAPPRDDVLQPYAADWAFRQGYKNVAILHDKTALGEGQATQFKAKWEELGGTVVLYEGTTFGDTDFSGVLTKVKSAAPDLLYCGCNSNQSGNIVRQAKQLNAAPQFLITDSGVAFDEVAGDAKAGVYTINNLGPNDIPGNEGWLKKYEDRWGEPAGIYSHMYYALTDVLLASMQETGGTNQDAMRDWLHNVKDYPSVFGSITFDAKGDNIDAEIGIFQITEAGYPYTVVERRNDVVQ